MANNSRALMMCAVMFSSFSLFCVFSVTLEVADEGQTG
jgi:hypothetical protein